SRQRVPRPPARASRRRLPRVRPGGDGRHRATRADRRRRDHADRVGGSCGAAAAGADDPCSPRRPRRRSPDDHDYASELTRAYRIRRIDAVARGGVDRAMIERWPEGERPRERLYWNGPGALADSELLALQLGSGTRGRTAIDVAREVLAT